MLDEKTETVVIERIPSMMEENLDVFDPSARKKGHCIPHRTTEILDNHSNNTPPGISPQKTQDRRSILQSHAETVEELRKWFKDRESSKGFKHFLRRTLFRQAEKVTMPSTDEIHASVYSFFPRRAEMKVIVCDFGEGKAERREVRLGDVEAEFQNKPEWSTIRWIHAPLGVGLLHSSVEELFIHAGCGAMGRPFTRVGGSNWPYLQIETIDLRSTKIIQDSRDLLFMLKPEKELCGALDEDLWIGHNNKKLRGNVEKRAEYLNKPVGFWELAEADLPRRMSEGSPLNLHSPANGIQRTKLEESAQSLTRHAFYKDAYIARNAFRAFHRHDDFVLTLSSGSGVDYLNTNLPHYLEQSREDLFSDHFASAIKQIYMEFSESGTDTWSCKSVEWFLVYLFTEVGATPHDIRQGRSVPSLMDAYDAIVHELKERRYDEWQRNETINLVRAYLGCIDELDVLEGIYSRKLDFFQRLKRDIRNFEREDRHSDKHSEDKEGEWPLDRIAFAEQLMEESATQCKRLSADLRESKNSLFQLRSIEQNELAIIANTQNKAIFVFTGVTIVFLPLSFFTSYFGMNLKGIVQTNRTEVYFWKVCGTVAIAIVLVVGVYAMRYRMGLGRRVWAPRPNSDASSV